MPIHNAEPQKNIKIRQTKERKALGSILRGFSDSAATIDTYSGPQILHYQPVFFKINILATYEKVACMTQANTPKNLPVLPVAPYSINAPFVS